MTHSWGSKFVVIVFYFIVHTKIRYFVGTRIRWSDPHENHENWYPTKIKQSTVFVSKKGYVLVYDKKNTFSVDIWMLQLSSDKKDLC